MKIISNTGDALTIASENREITLTQSEARALYACLRRYYFDAFFADAVDAAIEDNEIDLTQFDGTKEEFIDEVKSCLEVRILDIEGATEEQITEAVIDTASDYGLYA